MLLTDARRRARTGPDGELIPLDKQDRTLWDRGAIAEGVALISATLSRGAVGPYQLQAAIAAVHDEARAAEDTDWPQILALYGVLKRMSDNPMVTLNHAIAAAMVHGPRGRARSCWRPLDADPRSGRPLSPRRRARRTCSRWPAIAAPPIAHYRAAARTASVPERNYLHHAGHATLSQSTKLRRAAVHQCHGAPVPRRTVHSAPAPALHQHPGTGTALTPLSTSRSSPP